MNLQRLLLKASRWAKHPPSARQVAFYGGVVAAALLIAGIERFIGWPDWLTVNSLRTGR